MNFALWRIIGFAWDTAERRWSIQTFRALSVPGEFHSPNQTRECRSFTSSDGSVQFPSLTAKGIAMLRYSDEAARKLETIYSSADVVAQRKATLDRLRLVRGRSSIGLATFRNRLIPSPVPLTVTSP